MNELTLKKATRIARAIAQLRPRVMRMADRAKNSGPWRADLAEKLERAEKQLRQAERNVLDAKRLILSEKS